MIEIKHHSSFQFAIYLNGTNVYEL